MSDSTSVRQYKGVKNSPLSVRTLSCTSRPCRKKKNGNGKKLNWS
nr:MAG TPA: hypothetical protein [Caudoviricetes sp.]